MSNNCSLFSFQDDTKFRRRIVFQVHQLVTSIQKKKHFIHKILRQVRVCMTISYDTKNQENGDLELQSTAFIREQRYEVKCNPA